MRKATLTATTLLLAAPAIPAAATAATKTPEAVKKAAVSVEIVRSNTGKGSAVRVGPAGGAVTPAVLVSRTSEISLTDASKRPTPADRVESDAPTSLALLTRRGEKPSPGLTPAPERAKRGARVYVISRPVDRRAATAQITPTRVTSSTGDALVLRARHRVGLNGGAVVDAQGRLLAVTTPPLPGTPTGGPLRAVPVSDVPTPQTGEAATAPGGFPAVPVTIGLGILLLGSHLLLLRRRRSAASAPVAPAAAPTTAGAAPQAPAAAAPATAGVAPEDDFEVTLRPRG